MAGWKRCRGRSDREARIVRRLRTVRCGARVGWDGIGTVVMVLGCRDVRIGLVGVVRFACDCDDGLGLCFGTGTGGGMMGV
jgi:hypothetical protein